MQTITINITFYSDHVYYIGATNVSSRYSEGTSQDPSFWNNEGAVTWALNGTISYLNAQSGDIINISTSGNYNHTGIDWTPYYQYKITYNGVVVSPPPTTQPPTTQPPASVTINVGIVNGKGSVVASRNGTAVATINSGDGIKPISYNTGDSFRFQAYPDTALGYSFNKFCGDTSCTITSTTNPLTGTVSTSGNVYTFFTLSGTTPPPTSPPPSGTTPPPLFGVCNPPCLSNQTCVLGVCQPTIYLYGAAGFFILLLIARK